MFAFSNCVDQLENAAMAANPCWHRGGKEGFLHMSLAAWEGLCPLGMKCLLALQSWLWCSSLPGGVGSHLTTPTEACPWHGESLYAGAAQNSPLPRRRGEQMGREGVSRFWEVPFLPKSAMSYLCLCLCPAGTCPSLSDDPNLRRAVSRHLHNRCSPLPRH